MGKGIRAQLTNLKSVLSALKQYVDLRTVESSSKANGFIASLSDDDRTLMIICLQLVFFYVISPLEV